MRPKVMTDTKDDHYANIMILKQHGHKSVINNIYAYASAYGCKQQEAAPKAKELKARQKENLLHYPCTEFSVK